MPAIEVEDLFKSYGPVDAVRGISFRVEEGEVFALLGPNGAGKTTTLEILEGHRRRNGGRVSVLGGASARRGWPARADWDRAGCGADRARSPGAVRGQLSAFAAGHRRDRI